jgi:alkanesulfonate monooxygenase SsuD/methylene tetrahydromethanopterin reductase-like flavin-dependent oxidoreductase (luciferase family)
VKYGFVIPFGEAREVADLALLAEQAGWEAVFVWEPVWGNDAWVCLTAAAMNTRRIRLGTMLSPLSRMRPWKLASESATLDRLSGGRVILALGLGAVDTGFIQFGEVTERKTRAELLDEGLEIVTGLWRGQPFAFEGKHYHVQPTEFQPPLPPLQQPRIPIWMVGAWPSRKSMARALRCDGILPTILKPGPDGSSSAAQAGVEEIRQIAAFAREQRPAAAPFEIVVEGETPGGDPARARARIDPWAEAGATWWNETRWMADHSPAGLEEVRRRIQRGPPGA